MGSATQDVFARTDAETVTIRHGGEKETLLAYPLGTKILISELDFQIGGGGTNTATTFSRQGLKTGFLGRMGDDDSGKAVLRFLRKERIAFLGAAGGQTGFSVILDSEEDDRTILTFKGCNDRLRGEEATAGGWSARWLYCSSMLGESYETMLKTMATVKKAGGAVAFNPSIYQAKRGLGTRQKALSHVDVLILNKEEAATLVGHPAGLHDLLRVLAAAGPHTVIVTDGKEGATLFDGERFLSVRPSPEAKAVETTGAGDAFASGFVAGLARGLATREALLLGMLNAEAVIGHYGAKERILTRKEADALLAAEKRDVKEERPAS